ncbi:MAG: PKD domain-containing protein [Candidatus Acetothermia bacterium]|nr:PKD domain-containing protein [Candidatus Acetothermia bacterium]
MKKTLLSLVLCGLAVTAVAAPTFTDRSFGGEALNPGDTGIIVQVITVKGDSARDTTIEFIQVRNTGTATSSHITQIALALESTTPTLPTSAPATTAVRAPTTGKDLQVGIVIPTSFTVPKGQTRYLWVLVDVARPAAISGGETVVLETNAYWYTATESGNSGFLQDGRPETIRKAGFEVITDESPDPDNLNPGDSAPVQKFRIRDLDANARAVKVNKVTVKRANGATAEASDLQSIEVQINDGTATYTAATESATGWDGTGVVFTATKPPLPTSFPDGTELTITVTITVQSGDESGDATYPRDERTLKSAVVLEVEENTGQTINQTVTGPTTWTIRRAGFEEIEEISTPPPGPGINPGERLTQKIWVADRDYNGNKVQITHIYVKNLGTAETADIAGFTVWVGTTRVRSSWPSGFDFRIGGWIQVTPTDVADEKEATITIEYRVSPLATTGRTIRPEVRVGSEEPPVPSPPSPAYATAAVTYPETVAIYPAGFEVVENIAIDPRTVYSTQRFVAQKIKLEDKDANTAGVTITRVRVKNVGTASDTQFAKLEVRLAGENGALLGETTNLTGFRNSGVSITPTANNTVADGAKAELWIWVTLAGPDKTVAGRTVRLETVFSYTEGTMSGDTTAVRGATFDIGVNNPPVIQDFTWSPANPQYGQEITFTPGTITDPDGDAIVYSKWDFGEGASPRYVERNGPPETAKTKYPDGGTFTVTLLVRDAKGLEGKKTKQITVTLRPNQPPTVDFTWSPTSPAAGQAVTFTSTATDPDDPPDTPFTYAWTFGDGGTATEANPTHTYAAAGTYTVKLEVTDRRGAKGTKEKTITIGAPPPPPPPTVTALSASPAVPEAGQPVTLTATATAPQGDPVTAWEWDFNGDGTVDATGAPPVTHTYPAAGLYMVKVRARNQAGWSAWRTLDLYVRAKGGAEIGTRLLDNPAAAQARIQVFLPSGATDVKIRVFDALGRPVVERDIAGAQFTWDLEDGAGRTVPNGLYFYLITATQDGRTIRSEVGRILVLR